MIIYACHRCGSQGEYIYLTESDEVETCPVCSCTDLSIHVARSIVLDMVDNHGEYDDED